MQGSEDSEPAAYSQSLDAKDVDVVLISDQYKWICDELHAHAEAEYNMDKICEIEAMGNAATNAEWGYLNKCRVELVSAVLLSMNLHVIKYG